ncbi:hypothetical protein Zmor_028234 [Zophobas morio]|uniref:DUF7769 domain-containing protein n=1 Tax=Zophobas morio TaxID=2755281 RepID=A0AA38HPW3_9CUCU|nr:hypothetical protein Zmor_028234 [Zophobas morio]
MENFEVKNAALQVRASKYKQLTVEERNGILQDLLQLRKRQKLKHGAINEVAADFDVTRLTVFRIWHAAQRQYNEGKVCADVSSKKKRKCGRKRKDYSTNLAAIPGIAYNRRGTSRSLSSAVDILKSTLFDIFKQGAHLRQTTLVSSQEALDKTHLCLN